MSLESLKESIEPNETPRRLVEAHETIGNSKRSLCQDRTLDLKVYDKQTETQKEHSDERQKDIIELYRALRMRTFIYEKDLLPLKLYVNTSSKKAQIFICRRYNCQT